MGFIRSALVLVAVAISARMFKNYFNKGAYVVSLIDFSSKVDYDLHDSPFRDLRQQVEESAGTIVRFLRIHLKTKDSHSPDTFNLTAQDWDIVMLTWYEDEKKAKTISEEGLEYYKNTEKPVSRWYSVPFDCKSNTFLVLLNIGLDIKGFIDKLRGVGPFEQSMIPNFSLKADDLRKNDDIYVLDLIRFKDKDAYENLYAKPVLWSMGPTIGQRPSYMGTSLEKHWEKVSLVRFPSFEALMSLLNTTIYNDLYVNRKKWS